MAEIDPWKTRSDEEEADDLFLEEEGDEDGEKKKKLKSLREEAQQELKNAGMLLVSGSDWKKKLKGTLIEACIDEKNRAILQSVDFAPIFESVEKASKATCLVRRRVNGKSRLKYYENMKDDEGLNKAKEGKGGTGTGFLVFPKSKFGWFVITNNHVIMDEEEAESADVIFDHLNDESLPDKTKWFKVKQLVSKDIRTEHAEDYKSLDFSVLTLESGNSKFLEEYAVCRFDERDTNEICTHETILRLSGVKFRPIIAFSHPKCLGKRISIGKFPNNYEKLPKSHIRHDLPTASGSSGANLIYCPSKIGVDKSDVFWNSAFLHYRHGKAVSWQAIGPVLRKDLSKLK